MGKEVLDHLDTDYYDAAFGAVSSAPAPKSTPKQKAHATETQIASSSQKSKPSRNGP